MADKSTPTTTILDALDGDEPDTPPAPVAAPVNATRDDGDGWDETADTNAAAPMVETETDDPEEEPKAEAPAAAEASMRDGETTYIVQRGFTVEGRTYHPGDTIMVKCKYCALWRKEWGNKVRCSPDLKWDDGTFMNAEKYSCESFFICKELEPELDAFLTMDLPEILTVRRMLGAAKQLLAVEGWIRKRFVKNADVNPAEVFLNAKGFVTSFTNADQLWLSEDFIRTYANLMAKKAKENATRKPRAKRPSFGRGDWVEWTDSKTQQRVKGIIMYSSKGQIHIAMIDGALAGQNFSTPTKEWKDKMNPKILRKATSTEI